jgi:hypothetical protein
MTVFLASCTKTEYITRTELVEVYVPQYRDFDKNLIDCNPVTLNKGITWGAAVLSLNEQLEKCVSSVQMIINTVNGDE